MEDVDLDFRLSVGYRVGTYASCGTACRSGVPPTQRLVVSMGPQLGLDVHKKICQVALWVCFATCGELLYLCGAVLDHAQSNVYSQLGASLGCPAWRSASRAGPSASSVGICGC
jgi:hypothetical protein